MQKTATCLGALLSLSAAVAMHEPSRADPTLMEAARRDAARFARELDKKPEAGAPQRFGREAPLGRSFDDAYGEAHRPLTESVTTGHDGNDRVFRIKTPLGVNLCMNYRDLDRFSPKKGKTVFLLACSR